MITSVPSFGESILQVSSLKKCQRRKRQDGLWHFFFIGRPFRKNQLLPPRLSSLPDIQGAVFRLVIPDDIVEQNGHPFSNNRTQYNPVRKLDRDLLLRRVPGLVH